jgi:hypothetical protein
LKFFSYDYHNGQSSEEQKRKRDDAMAKIMSPSTEQKMMTAGQVDKAVANFRVLLEKHAPEFPSEAVQTALGQPGLVGEMFAVFRKHVEAVSNMITRRVKVNRNREPRAVLDATGWKQYTNSAVVSAMPHGEGEEVDVVFFKLDRFVSDVDLEKEYELRGLKPADPYSLAAVNEVNPAFADEHLNSTHWLDADGKWCFAAFGRWGVERSVNVDRDGRGWDNDWWFAGLRK